MMKRFALPAAVALTALLGICSQDELLARGERYHEVSRSTASELIGGVDCQHYGPLDCGSAKTPDCPVTLCLERRLSPLIPPGKPSGSVWCGCNTDCTGQFMVKGLITCGS